MTPPVTIEFFRLTAKRRQAQGFSLIELALAVGVVIFALLPLTALLQFGLRTVQDSMDQTVRANIAQQLRGQFQQISFSASSTDPVTIQNLASQVNYYTIEGIKTEAPEAAYYQATFAVSDTTTAAGATYTGGNARLVTVTLSSPSFAPVSVRKKAIITLFVARQPSVN
jgi:uncharacterized protein (TIGR02598 family)